MAAQSINDAAVAMIQQRGMPMTTANLNRAMNIIAQQRMEPGDSAESSGSGVELADNSLPDSSTSDAPARPTSRMASAIDKSLQPRAGSNTATTGPQNPVANTRADSATPDKTGSTSSANDESSVRPMITEKTARSDIASGKLDGPGMDKIPDMINGSQQGDDTGSTAGDGIAGLSAGLGMAKILSILEKMVPSGSQASPRVEPTLGEPRMSPGNGVTIEGSLPAVHGVNPMAPTSEVDIMQSIRRLLGHGR